MLIIEELEEEIPVYDITVEGNHNFYANGILVHNCTEILEYTDKDETAVCNLASVALPKYVVIPTGKVREKDKCAKNVAVSLREFFQIISFNKLT